MHILSMTTPLPLFLLTHGAPQPAYGVDWWLRSIDGIAEFSQGETAPDFGSRRLCVSLEYDSLALLAHSCDDCMSNVAERGGSSV